MIGSIKTMTRYQKMYNMLQTVEVHPLSRLARLEEIHSDIGNELRNPFFRLLTLKQAPVPISAGREQILQRPSCIYSSKLYHHKFRITHSIEIVNPSSQIVAELAELPLGTITRTIFR